MLAMFIHVTTIDFITRYTRQWCNTEAWACVKVTGLGF